MRGSMRGCVREMRERERVKVNGDRLRGAWGGRSNKGWVMGGGSEGGE